MMRSIDVILYHAHIITLDPLKPYATAIAIHNGRILAVGSDDDILPLATPTTRSLKPPLSTISLNKYGSRSKD